MDFMYINDENATEEELLKILKNNSETLRFKKSEIARLKKASLSGTIEIKDATISVEFEKLETKREFDEDFEEEVNYYMSEIRNIKDKDFDTAIYDALPVRTHYEYKKIILRIIAELNKDIKDIYEIIIAEQETMDIDELLQYKNEILLLEHKKELLRKTLMEKVEIKSNISTQNRMIFASTSGGNIRIFDDLKSIPTEYYPAFLELFKSIKDGTFKNIRRFSNSNSLNGLLEVKLFKVRVFFDRISKNNYAIIGATLKKFDNDKAYRIQLANKYAEYKKNVKEMKANLNKEEFLELHSEYERELFSLLGNELESELEKVQNGGKK